ncbi:MAG: hypothetical protein NZ455_01480 [Bacteroidia bacterium]|nr:hypothetical protein [Bacteroidia bacterium]MDW8346814.1 hypothetical protein [Bacteroidia bacterium]
MTKEKKYLWILRRVQAQDTVFMNDFAKFLQKHPRNTFHFILYLDTEEPSIEAQHFQAKRISGFLSEHLVSNTVFHLHQWGILKQNQNTYYFDQQKITQCFTLSTTIVFTCVWESSIIPLSLLLEAFGSLFLEQVFVFANNPHLNIRTQDYTQILSYPNEEETANLFRQVKQVFESISWVSHLNNIKIDCS